MFDIEDLSPDNLEQLIVTLETTIASARAIQIKAITELDRAQVATTDGCRSMTDWISSRLGPPPRRSPGTGHRCQDHA
jgi:hypothetical protein